VRNSIQLRIWRRSIPIAWNQTRIVQPTKVALSVAIAALNILWVGHGILRTSSPAIRFVVVAILTYVIATVVEFLWLLSTGPRFTGFESPNSDGPAAQRDSVDSLVAELSALPPTELRDETLEFAKELKDFEAGSDREFVKTLAGSDPITVASESERDDVLDKQSVELFEHDLRTWRVYREKFYRPARAFRDELRKRLGIRNVNSEPRIPALDQAQPSGAKPLAQAADYLAGLARRLK
jgi:hypothetical protein